MLETILKYATSVEFNFTITGYYTIAARVHDWSTGVTKTFELHGDDLVKLIGEMEIGLRALYEPIQFVVTED